MSVGNPYAAKTPKPAKEASGEVVAPEEPKTPEVPAGSISEVLAWVGDDLDRAKLALDAEKAGHARKSLVKKLTGIVDGADH